MLGQEPPRTLPRQAPLSTAAADRAASRGVLLLLAALLFGGCAGVADVTGTASQTDLYQLRADLTAVNQAAQRARTEAEALAAQTERRARERAAEDERRTQTVTQRLDTLTTALAALTGRIDDLTARVDLLNRQSRTAAPPATTATAPPSPGTTPMPAPRPAAPPVTATPLPSNGATIRPSTSLQPDDIYQAAYIDFSKGSYSLAIAGFRGTN